jgi:hypothetical protein
LTRSISRKLYQRLFLLYPEPFRHEFKDEMLSIFEECRGAQGSWRLLTDLVLSAAKQQVHYRSTPVPKGAPLYSEIASPSSLARTLTITVIGAALLAGVFAGGKPEMADRSFLANRREALFWFPTAGWGRYCSDVPEHTRTAGSLPLASVLVAKTEAPESLRVVRVACGQSWSSR